MRHAASRRDSFQCASVSKRSHTLRSHTPFAGTYVLCREWSKSPARVRVHAGGTRRQLSGNVEVDERRSLRRLLQERTLQCPLNPHEPKRSHSPLSHTQARARRARAREKLDNASARALVRLSARTHATPHRPLHAATDSAPQYIMQPPQLMTSPPSTFQMLHCWRSSNSPVAHSPITGTCALLFTLMRSHLSKFSSAMMVGLSG